MFQGLSATIPVLRKQVRKSVVLHRALRSLPRSALRFRDHLRRCPTDRDEYAKLKLRLQAENTNGIGEYLEKKAPFIDGVLNRIMDA
jgi:GrpB-like predicted nucleotidyltransferase (UPF0157 family)